MKQAPAYLFALAALALIGHAVATSPPSSLGPVVRARTFGDIISGTMTMTATVSATSVPTATSTVTPTLAPEWGVDRLCACHVPPLEPGSPACERLKAEYVGTVVAGWASQTALARGTDTPAPPPSPTPPPTLTPSATPLPTEEPTPSPAPTWTPRVGVVTATPAPVAARAWIPFAFLRRPRR